MPKILGKKRDRVRKQDPDSASPTAISPSSLPEEEASNENLNLLPLIRHLNSTAAANLSFPGPHHDATLKDIQQALDWYAAHPAGNKGRIKWCSTRLRELQMRVGLWRSEFEKVEDGFKITITSPSGKSWTRLEKTDSLKNAQKAFRDFAEFWVNGKEPSSLQGMEYETAIADSSQLTAEHKKTTAFEPPKVISVEMTPEEQDVYALMGISPLVRLNPQVKNSKSAIISLTTHASNQPALLRDEEQPPLDPPATSREEQLPTELPAVSRKEQLPQEWDNAHAAAAVSREESCTNVQLEVIEVSREEQLPTELPAVSRKEQLPQEWDNAHAAAAVSREESCTNVQLEVIEVYIASLRTHEKFQPRVGLNENAVERYQQMLETTEPPPIQIWHGTPPGEKEADYIIDGHHRLAASKRAGKKTIKAKRITNDWALAVYVANTANLDNGLQLDKWEIESACKNLIRVAKDLSSEATKEILTQLAKKTGKTYRALNNTAIANLFGYSHPTIMRYKQDIEKEEAIAAFQPGQWVLMHAPEDSTDINAKYLRLLPEEYRLAKVIHSIRIGVKLKPDHPRLAKKIWRLEPEWLTIVPNKPKKVKSTNFKPGDDVRHWLSEKTGTVVSIDESHQNPWTSWDAITKTHPLVKWHHTGLEEAEEGFELDLIGFSEPLTIEQRISGLKAAIASIEGEGWEQDRLHRKLTTQIKTLQARLTVDCEDPSDGSNPIESPSANNTEFHSVKKEEHAIAKSVGLREKNGQLLPDTDHSAYSKHPEDPRTTAVGTLELPANSPAADSLFLEAKRARAFAAIDTLKTCHDALTKKELIELISWCRAQIDDRT